MIFVLSLALCVHHQSQHHSNRNFYLYLIFRYWIGRGRKGAVKKITLYVSTNVVSLWAKLVQYVWCYTPDRDYSCILWNPQSTMWILMNGVISCSRIFCDSDVNSFFYYLMLYMARFRMTVSTLSQGVTKNLTGHRMHWGRSKLPQTYPWWQSFQEMKTCSRRKLTLWPGKLIFCREVPEFRFFARIWVSWLLWKDLDAKPLSVSIWYHVNFWGTSENFGV